MDSNYKFKGSIVKKLIKNKGLTKHQAKKLICIGTISDASANIYPGNSQWYLETNPEKELHNFFYDLFLFAYNLRLPTYFINCKGYRKTGFRGKKYIPIVKDLFNFSPTFKARPNKGKNGIENISSKNPTMNSILKEEKWLKKLALRLYFDFEGFISPKFTVKNKPNCVSKKFQFQFSGRLGISITNKKLVKELKNLASSLKIHLNILNDNRSWSGISAVGTEKRKSIFKFNEIGGFLTNVKISNSKSNKGISKQIILETCCKVLKNKCCSKHFSSKQKANQFREKFKENVFKPIRKYYQNKYFGGPGRI